MHQLTPSEISHVSGGWEASHGLGIALGTTVALAVYPFASIMAAFATDSADPNLVMAGLLGFEATVYSVGYCVGYTLGSGIDYGLGKEPALYQPDFYI